MTPIHFADTVNYWPLASQAEGHEFESRLPLIMKALIVNRLAIEVFCF